MNQAAKRHQKKLARKATKNRRGRPPQPLGQGLGGAPAHQVVELIQKGAQLHQAGQVQEAETIYRHILDINPDHADANHLMGVLHSRAGNHGLAVDMISRAIAMAPDQSAYHSNLGNALKRMGRLEEAIPSYHKALAIKPDFADAHGNLGAVLQELGRLEEAIASYHKALAINPDDAATHNNLGDTLQEQGRLDDAWASYHKALAIKPDYADAHNNLGTVLQEQGRLDDAVASYHQALAIKPDYAAAHNNLGNALQKLGRLDNALASYHQALAIQPDYAVAHNNLGDALQEQGRLDDAWASYHKALAIKPDYADAHNNLGTVLQQLGRLDEASASYHQALAIKPDYADAHNNLGTVLQQLGRPDDALTSYHKALAIEPDYAAAHNNVGNALQVLGRSDDALASYRRALAIKPDFADADMHIAQIKKHSEYDNDIQAMEEKYANPDISDKQRMYLAFGLGKAFEDLRQYEKAFDFLLEGNAIKQQTQSYSFEAQERFFNRQKEIFNSSLFDTFQGVGCENDSPIFILGLPRSGSTLVEQILASHSQVFGAGEVKILPRVLSKLLAAALTEYNLERDAAEFERLGMEYIDAIGKDSKKGGFITDKLLSNFKYIGLIKLILPNAKIIHCCRNPLDNCLSIFKTLFSDDGLEYATDLIELGRFYNLYRDLMAHWHHVLPDFIYNIQYEEMVADQAAQTRLLLNHCGLEWEDACLEFHKTDRPVLTASLEQVRRPIYKDSVHSWKRYEKQLAPLIEILG